MDPIIQTPYIKFISTLNLINFDFVRPQQLLTREQNIVWDMINVQILMSIRFGCWQSSW